MLCPLAIVVLLLAGALEPWMIIVLSLVVGVTDALSMPSFQSIVPSIVERDQIGRGLALNSTQFSLSRILGPSIAGVLMASAGAVACFVVSVVSYLPFIGVALWILPRWKPPTTAQAPQHFRHTAASMTALLREPHSGIAMTVSSTAANTLLQATANPLVLGQTVSLILLAMRGGISLGALLTGVSVSLIGVRQALLLNGLMAILVQGAIAWKWLRATVPPVPAQAEIPAPR